MPIQFLIEHDHFFGPDEIAKLVEAFEGVLGELGLVRRDDPATMLVAKAIMDAAKTGERDPKRLRELAVRELTAQAAPSIAPDEHSDREQAVGEPARTAGPSATTAASAAERRGLRTPDGLDVPTPLTSK
jgi:hypothetical protein